MTDAILWSAINISEGRDTKALQILVDKLGQTGAKLADWSSDSDHHRSVFSLVGTASELEQSIVQIFHWAENRVNLAQHAGEHPRLGAVDVVPFVPLSSAASVDHAREAAQRVAQKVAQKFNIPVFLYRQSSTSEPPLTLPNLRRGGPSKLRERLENGELRVDFGPTEPHPRLGVSIFGARTPLTAFNCVLNTKDLTLGKAIAREIRASNGGVPHLQALAFVLESRENLVQISMNILEPKETPPHVAYLAVAKACERRQLEIVDSELIGLLQIEALKQAFQHFLKLPTFHTGQIAEWNLITDNQGKEA